MRVTRSAVGDLVCRGTLLLKCESVGGQQFGEFLAAQDEQAGKGALTHSFCPYRD